MIKLKPEHFKKCLAANQPLEMGLKILVDDLQHLINDSQRTPAEYYAALTERIGISDPEKGLCAYMVYDRLDCIDCSLCPLGPRPSGCLELMQPLLRKCLTGSAKDIQLELIRLHHEITVVISASRALPD